MMQLFELYWSFHILRNIVNETNWYIILCTNNGELPRGISWKLFIFCGILGLACHMVVYGCKETTKFEELLDERRFGFPLLYHFKNYITGLF